MEIKKRFIVMFIVAAVVWISIAILVHIYFFTPVKIPYGVWHSDNPEITIDIDPSNTKNHRYYGEYIKDGETLSVFMLFTGEGNGVGIYDISCEIEHGVIFSPYSTGGFKYSKKEEKLYYYLSSRWQEETGYETIVFEKIHSYD